GHVVGVATRPEHVEAAPARVVANFTHEAGLADTRLTFDEHHTTLAAQCEVDAVHEDRSLVAPSYERHCSIAPAQRRRRLLPPAADVLELVLPVPNNSFVQRLRFG